jgi:hypothetical protein
VPDHRRLLLISILVLTALFFIEYFFLRDLLPEYIPYTSFKANGAFLIICLIGVYFVVFKRIIKQNPELSVGYLIVFGVLIALFSEVIFQVYRLFNFEYSTNAEKARYFFTAVLAMSAIGSIMAVNVAIDVKYNSRWINFLVIAGMLLIFYLAGPYVLNLMKILKGENA